MMEKIKKFLSHLFTEADNNTFDLTKILAFLSIVVGLSLSIVSVVINAQTFVFQDFGIGVGALFTGLGVALGFKKESKDV